MARKRCLKKYLLASSASALILLLSACSQNYSLDNGGVPIGGVKAPDTSWYDRFLVNSRYTPLQGALQIGQELLFKQHVVGTTPPAQTFKSFNPSFGRLIAVEYLMGESYENNFEAHASGAATWTIDLTQEVLFSSPSFSNLGGGLVSVNKVYNLTGGISPVHETFQVLTDRATSVAYTNILDLGIFEEGPPLPFSIDSTGDGTVSASGPVDYQHWESLVDVRVEIIYYFMPNQ